MTDILLPRDVPLGGLRAMNVRRTLPQRQRSLIGAWCFLDHYGPDRVADTGGMLVAPHPHIGLQTVSWLFGGTIEHRDSIGTHALVKPGELNLMTAGRGISHSEVSTDEATVLHGVQLWVALPSAVRDTEPAFRHYAPPVMHGEGWDAQVFLGSLLGSESPVETFSPLVGAEIILDAGTTLTPEVEPGYEYGVLVDFGAVHVNGEEVTQHHLAYVAPGEPLEILADDLSHVLLIGGRPLGEDIVMWWNFVGRDHEEISEARNDWMAQISDNAGLVQDGTDAYDGRFGIVGDHLTPIPAPVMPNARLKARA
ncbi:pirin family protein [Nocardioides cynanchi]|uniref:pirin family protein n=1 Tax=Nocardioides cynanchi TaxID=2558918 RepID=UPI001EE200BD|nr:pirin family protein [Nocardioides cynanchi]